MDGRGISAPWVQSKVGDYCFMLSSYGYHLQNEEDMSARIHGFHQGHSASQADDKIKTDLSQSLSLQPLQAKILDAPVLCLPHYLGYIGPETCVLRQPKRPGLGQIAVV